MLAKDLLKHVDLGASVAEFDTDLERYFIETDTFRSVVADKGDIIAGDKGTGKTAIYRVLKNNYRSYDQLENIEIVDAFNVQGNPIFQRLLAGPALTEGQYRTVWKAYIFALVGNWLVDIYSAEYNDELKELKNTLDYMGLSSVDVSPSTIFGNLYNLVRRLTNPTAVETQFTVTETGMPVVTPRIEMGPQKEEGSEIYTDDFLATLERAAESTDFVVWVLFDRLDEAFSGSPEVEIPALRALMRTYLDLTALKNIRLKLFVRKDLFRRIVEGGFVNLTHINARRIDIVWDEDDLISMVCRRLLRNLDFVNAVGGELADDQLFSILLPEQIDVGDRKPSSKTWIMGRIRDGNNNKPPRNLIDLLNKSKEAQARREARDGREIDSEKGPIIEADSVKRAFSQLSEMRVQDTLLAEANDLAELVQRFRDGKSEHNTSTLSQVYGNDYNPVDATKSLIDLGFLEEFGSNYKIPMLYRDGLKITQGKAF